MYVDKMGDGLSSVLIAVLVLQRSVFCVITVAYFIIFLFFMNVGICLLLLVFAYYAVSSLPLYDHLVLHTHQQVTPIPQGV